MNPQAGYLSRGDLVVGVDIGGTKTAILVCEPDNTVRARVLAPTAVGASDRAANAIAALVTDALREAGAWPGDVAALGVGVPGRVDRDRGHVTLAVNLDWHDLPLGPRLETLLGIPTVVENDVRAAALGLHRRRLFGSTQSLAFLAIGTGIAAGGTVAFFIMGIIALNSPIRERVNLNVRPQIGLGSLGVEGSF